MVGFHWPKRDERGGLRLTGLQDGSRLEPPPPATREPMLALVESEQSLSGLDWRTGESQWRCEGPGRVAVLTRDGDAWLPLLLFHVEKPEATIYRQAVPLGPDGRYALPQPSLATFGPSPEDNWQAFPLPWEAPGRKRLNQAVLPALGCLALLVLSAFRQSRPKTILLVACLLIVPAAVGGLELMDHRLAPEQRFDWKGWYWLWPYALSLPGRLPLILPLLMLLGVCLVWRLHRRPWVLTGLAACLALIWLFGQDPADANWNLLWALRIPGGLWIASPMPWMIAVSLWTRRREPRKAKAIEGVTR